MTDRQTDQQTAWPTPEGIVRKGMKVLDADGTLIGTVDHIVNGEVLLEGEPESFVSVTQIDGVSADAVLLSDRGDATFGLGAQP